MKLIFGIVSVCVLSFIAVKPLLGRAYFPMHDDTQVGRVVVMGRALREGQFPVRWVSDLGYGYGYPIFNFYGPLPYYVGGGLYALGIDSVTSTKLMFGLGVMLASVFCFLLLKSLYGTLGALIGSVLFTYAPYHAVEIYIRGAVGEYWALAFVPLVLWGMLLVSQQKKYIKGITIGGMGLAGVIASHTILGFLTVMLSLIGIGMFWIMHVMRKAPKNQKTVFLLSVVAVGLGVSAFFWLPAILEMKSTGVSSMITNAPTGFFDHFVCMRQLWDSSWGYGGSAMGCTDDGMSFKLGKFHTAMAVLGFLAWVIWKKKNKKSHASTFMIIGLLLFSFSIFGMLDISKLFWGMVPYVSFIQYPWRLLSYSTLAIAIIGGFVITLFYRQTTRLVAAGVVIVGCIWINGKLFQPQYLYERDPKAFETFEELHFRVSKVSDEYLPAGVVKPKTLNDVSSAVFKAKTPLDIHSLVKTDTFLRVELESPVGQSVVIQKAFFPGWHYWVNKKEVTPSIVLGLPSVIVSEGKSIIEFRFSDTPVRIWGNMISLLSVTLLGVGVFYDKKTNT